MPAVPDGRRTGGVLVLVAGGILLLLVSFAIGAGDGAGWGWTLILAVAAAAAAIWWWDYRRRLREDAERRDRELYELSEFTVVDQMRGHPDFELYCAGILPGMGYTNVEWIGRGGDGGMDILAVDPDGKRAGVQCKRLSKPVGPELFRTMAGTVTAGRHAGRRPVLMTNARVTDDGRAAAEERAIRVIDRARLGRAMWELRSRVRAAGAVPQERRADDAVEAPPAGPGTAVPQRSTTDARVMLSVVACAAPGLLGPGATDGGLPPWPRDRSGRSYRPAPGQVGPVAAGSGAGCGAGADGRAPGGNGVGLVVGRWLQARAAGDRAGVRGIADHAR